MLRAFRLPNLRVGPNGKPLPPPHRDILGQSGRGHGLAPIDRNLLLTLRNQYGDAVSVFEAGGEVHGGDRVFPGVSPRCAGVQTERRGGEIDAA